MEIDMPHPRHRTGVRFAELRRSLVEALGLQVQW